jgi:signal transduction histidine kinase/ligand-binding sensor domain-containing protein
MGCTRSLLGRVITLTGVVIGLAARVAAGQASQLPPPTLTGPNGEYIHDTWRGSSHEFPDVSVLALAQDHLGFLLVASPRGIYRFDGSQFLGPWTFPLNGVEAILVEKSGALWAASQTVVGLARRSPDGTTSQVLLPGGDRPVGPVGGMARAPDGAVYVSVADGIFRIRGGVQARLSPPGPSGLLAVSPDGTLWAGIGGLRALRADAFVPRPDLWNPAGGSDPTAMMFDRGGQLWLGDKDGLVVVSTPARQGGGTIRRFPKARLGVAGTITVLMEDERGRVWIGTAGGGVSRFDEGRFTSFSSDDGLSDDHVTALLQDRDGNIWIGTRGGLDRLRPRAIRILTVREGLDDNDVWSVAVEPGGSILLGTRHGGISRLRGGRITPVRDARGAALEQWSGALEPRRDGTLYFSSQRPVGTWRLDPRGVLSRWTPAGGHGFTGAAYSFFSDPDGTLWTGDSSRALYRVRGDAVKEFRDPAGRLTEPIWGITRDSSGTMWLAAGALYRVAGDNLERVCEAGNPQLFSALLATDAGLWFGTGIGSQLSLYRGGRCVTLRGQGIPVTDVYAIERDRAGRIWVAASEGLLQYEEAGLLRRATDPQAPLESRLFDRLDGLLSVEFNCYGDSPSAVTPDGMLLFGSAGGLVVIDPANVPRIPNAPRPVILSALLNNAAYQTDGRIAAPLGAGRLEFAITAPALGLPERLRLQYRLDGKDATWLEAGDRRRITYAGLGGGDYTFRVRAANENGVWSTQEARVSLRLQAPFTSTVPFFLLLGALLMGSGLGVGAIRNRVIARRGRQLEHLVAQRTSELAEARDRLEERVAERTAALAQESAERLKVERNLHEAQKMESVGRLAGGVAHDLNNMLTVVLGNAEVLRDALGQTAHAEEVEQIASASNRAARLTNQLLSFARRQVGQPRVLQLDLLVRDLEPMLRRLVTGRVALVLDLAPGLWNIWADRAQLEQVLVNLTMNAHDAMPDGGTLTIGTSNTILTEADVSERVGMEPGDYVRLSVRDTGVGMAPQVLAHVFEPFYTTKDTGKGTGLGLASCYGIARQWGGHIGVTSEVGRGAAFEMLFPRSRLHLAAEVEDSPPAHVPGGRGERILLVDDEPTVRLVARRLLELAGYAVTEASDGEEALAHLDVRQLPVDLVLSDVVMPRMNGKALADHLRRTHPGLPVVLMTGYSHGMLSESGLLDQAYRVIGKPLSRTTLLTEIHEALEPSRGQNESG